MNRSPISCAAFSPALRPLALLALLAACGQSSSTPPAAEQSIGPQGGAVMTTDGSGVTVPAGALSSNVNITVAPTTNEPAPLQATVVGTALTLGPEGQQFATPVTVTLAFDPASLDKGHTAADIVVLTAPAGSASYTPLATSVVDAVHVSAPTTHFSTFVATVSNQCSTDEVSCAGICALVASDPQNCGACGKVCAANQSCSAGQCVDIVPLDGGSPSDGGTGDGGVKGGG